MLLWLNIDVRFKVTSGHAAFIALLGKCHLKAEKMDNSAVNRIILNNHHLDRSGS